MSKNVLVLLSHPYLATSSTHRNISDKLEKIPGVTVRHIDSLHLNDGHFDAKVEQELWENASSIVLEFPLYWYHSPASLKQYLDDVLTENWAYQNAYKLEGKNLVVLTTTGGVESLYAPSGEHGFNLSEILTPYKALASFTKMNYLPESVIYAANFLERSELEDEITRVCDQIEQLTK